MWSLFFSLLCSGSCCDGVTVWEILGNTELAPPSRCWNLIMMSSVEQSLHHGFNMMSYSAGVLVFVDNYDDDSSFDDGGVCMSLLQPHRDSHCSSMCWISPGEFRNSEFRDFSFNLELILCSLSWVAERFFSWFLSRLVSCELVSWIF